MSKSYVCNQCGFKAAFHYSLCPKCQASNSFVVEIKSTKKERVSKAATLQKPDIALGKSSPVLIKDVVAIDKTRISTGINEFNRVLGGGLVNGSLILLGGVPGTGKSTISMALSANLSKQYTVLYVSGEESESQIKMRADRLGIVCDKLYLVYENDIDVVINEHIATLKPDVVIIDSVSAMTTHQKDTEVGSPAQAVYAMTQLRYVAKSTGIIILTIGQVTKEGIIAGSNKLNHDVDVVAYLEGDEYDMYRIMRTQKNRFGSTGEIGVFEMTEQGLIEVPNPSESFLANRATDKPGSAVAITMEGTRPVTIEVQSLCIAAGNNNPARRSSGINRDRMFLIAAVIEKTLPFIELYDSDIFMSIAGGIKINEPALDLAMAASLVSSSSNVIIPSNVALIGEVGLTGEIRVVQQIETRIREAANLGFTKIITPVIKRNVKIPNNVNVVQVKTLLDAIKNVFGDALKYEPEFKTVKQTDMTKNNKKETDNE